MKHAIGVDARMWRHPGIGRYIRELSKAMIAEPHDLDLHFFASDDFLAEGTDGKNASYRFHKTRSTIYGLGEQWEMTSLARTCDLMHIPHFNVPFFSGRKLVVTLHDLIYLEKDASAGSLLRQFYVRTCISAIQRMRCSIVAVSEATKTDILSSFPKIAAERITVVHEAASSCFYPVTDAGQLKKEKEKSGLPRPFILFVGTLKPHKNLGVLVEAVRRLRESMDVELVVAGRRDPGSPETMRLIEEHRSMVRYLGEVSDDTLNRLYNLAEALVLPSLKEGFGLPLVEAMVCGTPVIAADRSSLPEIVGQGGTLFDPSDASALTTILLDLLSNPSRKERLSRAALDRANTFSWKKTAQKTLQVYEKALSAGAHR